MKFLKLSLTVPKRAEAGEFEIKAEGEAGQIFYPSRLPFFQDSECWRRAVIKALGAVQFRSKDFLPKEIDWMKEAGLLTNAGTAFSNQIQEVIGKKIYESLFATDESKQLLQGMLTKVGAREQLHIQLQFSDRLDQRGRLPDYPWELAHDGKELLARKQVVFSRFIAFLENTPNLPPVKKINVLLISSSAYDEEMGLKRFEQLEEKAISTALKQVEKEENLENSQEIFVTRLKSKTFKELGNYLTKNRGANAPHLIHFDGHGFFGKRCDDCRTMHNKVSEMKCRSCGKSLEDQSFQGYLLFEPNEENLLQNADYISGAEIGELLQKVSLEQGLEHGLRLVVMSACKTGMALGGDSVFNGVAQALIEHQVPAVVAMQYNITVGGAKTFCERFYRAIRQKCSITQAVSLGQSAMGYNNQWYRPVLYLRWWDNEGGQIFAPPPPIPTSSPDSYREFLSRLPPVDLHHFQNRFFATTWVGEFLNKPDKRIMILVGRRGIGKTTMISCAIKRLISEQPSNQSEQVHIKNIGYISPSIVGHRMVAKIFDGLCETLDSKKAEEFKSICESSDWSRTDKIKEFLLEYSSQETLIIIDDFEVFLNSETLGLQDQELEQILCSIRDFPCEHKLKVILISAVTPRHSQLLQEQFELRELTSGLESPYAERYLRQIDYRDLLKSESDESLRQACERINGFPRALNALYNTLVMNLNISLADLIDNAISSFPRKYQDVIDNLIGKEFRSLTPFEQKVMQIMAVYNHPILPHAIQQLLQQFGLTIDTQITLDRLVDKKLVKISQETKEYYIEPGDAEYAFSQLERGEAPVNHQTNVPQFTQLSLLNQAANYLQKIGIAMRQNFPDLPLKESLVVQVELALMEFDLRYKGEEYDHAASALLGIGTILLDLGDYSIVAERYERLLEKISDLYLKSYCLTDLGSAYFDYSQYKKAIQCYQQSLSLALENKDIELEGKCEGNLGNCFHNLGQINLAIEHYRKALAIAKSMSNKELQGTWLSNLGICYHNLGQTDEAILCHHQALEIFRETKNVKDEGITLSNLGICYGDLGKLNQAVEYHQKVADLINFKEYSDLEGQYFCNLGNCYVALGKLNEALEYYEQALTVYQSIGNWFLKGTTLHSLAEALIDLDDYTKAIEQANEGVKIGNKISSPKLQIENHCALARAYLYSNNLSAAYDSAQIAQQLNVPQEKHWALVLLGVICLRQGNRTDAREAFSKALQQASQLLTYNSSNYRALNTKGLALSALPLCGRPTRLSDTLRSYRDSQIINQNALGVSKRILRLVDELAMVASSKKFKQVQAKISEILTQSRKIKCPRCNSLDIKKNGHRQGKQKYLCKACGRHFV
jgi:tetratricopeptide (TPR) repeat protein